MFQSTREEKVDKLYQHFLALQQVLAWRFGHVSSGQLVGTKQDSNEDINREFVCSPKEELAREEGRIRYWRILLYF